MSRSASLGLVLLSMVSLDPARAEIKNRAEFSTETSFGAIAWVGTAEQDLNRNFVTVMGHCEALDKNKRHYFFINHRNPKKEGSVGYFMVEIILSKNGATSASVQYVKLYRNSDWLDKTDEFEIVLDRPEDIDLLYTLHSDPDGLTKIPRKYSDWHATSKKGSPTSFEQSGFRVRADTRSSYLQRQNYLLIKASATSWKRSKKIPEFNFQAGDADRGTIRVSAPEFALEPSEYRLSFGSPCP